MKTIVMEYTQSEIKILSTILNSKTLNEIARVLEYSSNEKWGYQRKLKMDHVNSILKYLKEEKNHLFPTSIILALSEKDFNNIEKKYFIDKNSQIYEIDLKGLDFHIVDGQHRLEALKKSNNNIDLSTLILIVPEKERQIEVDVFTTINSKAKRIPIDLAELAKYKYILLSEEEEKQELNIDDSIDYVSMKIAIDLNISESVWKKGIKVDINDEFNEGIVGISAFKKTIKNIVNVSLKDLFEKNPKMSIDQLDTEANKIKDFLISIWQICYDKWLYCFEKSEDKYYSKDYYIQKTLGISVIHGLLKEVFNIEDFNLSTKYFKELLDRSNVKAEDWKVGGKMSGYSSESGFEKIRKFIKGENLLNGE